MLHTTGLTELIALTGLLLGLCQLALWLAARGDVAARVHDATGPLEPTAGDTPGHGAEAVLASMLEAVRLQDATTAYKALAAAHDLRIATLTPIPRRLDLAEVEVRLMLLEAEGERAHLAKAAVLLGEVPLAPAPTGLVPRSAPSAAEHLLAGRLAQVPAETRPERPSLMRAAAHFRCAATMGGVGGAAYLGLCQTLCALTRIEATPSRLPEALAAGEAAVEGDAANSAAKAALAEALLLAGKLNADPEATSRSASLLHRAIADVTASGCEPSARWWLLRAEALITLGGRADNLADWKATQAALADRLDSGDVRSDADAQALMRAVSALRRLEPREAPVRPSEIAAPRPVAGSSG